MSASSTRPDRPHREYEWARDPAGKKSKRREADVCWKVSIDLGVIDDETDHDSDSAPDERTQEYGPTTDEQ